MIKAPIYSMEGSKTGEQTLNPGVFAVAVKPAVVHAVVVAQLANSRPTVAHTKDRSEVSGGGKKPWKQKGTGRARHGSIRSPLWRGGGITFGPRAERNYEQKVNRKIKQKALCMTLSDKAASAKIILLDELQLAQIKTKPMAQLLTKLGVQSKKKKTDVGSALFVTPKANATVRASVRNLPNVTAITANSLNVVDVLEHEWLVMPVAALDVIETTFAK